MSIFLAIILSCLIVAVGVFSDCQKIYTAKNKAENSVDSSLKSVLASYDKDLVEGYGLFAFNKNEDTQEMFNNYLKYNLIGLNGKINSPSENEISCNGNISDSEILKSQICDYMKYRTMSNIFFKIISELTEIEIQEYSASGSEEEIEYDSNKGESYRQLRNILKEMTKTIPYKWLLEQDEDTEKISKTELIKDDFLENGNVAEAVDGIIEVLKGILNTSKEKVYIAEYIFDKFTYWGRESIQGHYFGVGEIEYILWGSINQADNLLSSLKSIWSLRFVINTIIEFAESKDSEPITRIGIALTEGVVKATTDTVDLFNNKKVKFLKDGNFKMCYKDYMRLFAYIEVVKNEKLILKRIAQLIQNNIIQKRSSFNLNNYCTQVQAKISLNMRINFLSIFTDGRKVRIKYEKAMEY